MAEGEKRIYDNWCSRHLGKTENIVAGVLGKCNDFERLISTER